MSSQPSQRERGGHKLVPAFLPVPGDGPEATFRERPPYASVAEDGSTHAATSHPLTASAERQLLNTLTPERPVEVEAAGCARWLKPL